jgi:aldehyde:ferredoxin oxidoreductase
MKYKGYTGKILTVDLTARKIESLPLSERLAEDYIGGGGIAVKIISQMLKPGMDPLDESNPLVIMTGPLTGTVVPWSGRHCIAAISPLTGIWGEAYAGGTWGRELKKAGFDGIIITGKAEQPVFLKIINDNVTVEDAKRFKGKDTCETEALLKEECGGNAKVAAIGAAGEHLVRFAAIVHEGPVARTAARCGVGAVMGSKNLKAIVVKGKEAVEVAERKRLLQSIRRALPELVTDAEHRLKKARAVFSMFVRDGRPGVNNWRDGHLQGFEASLLKEIELHVREAKPYLCAGCRIGCVESNISSGQRETVWEVIAPLGSQCGITDMHYVKKAYEVCNRHGIDSISAGGVISFAMECFEEGILTEEDTDGIRLTFGNGDAMLAMLEKICRREGFGSILAEGTRGAARLIGARAEQFALEVKGLEIPAHDPRSHNFFALTYATDNRGAHHISVLNPGIEGSDLLNDEAVRFDAKGTAEMVVRRQHYSNIMNSLLLCMFSQIGFAQYYSPEGYAGITAKEVSEWFNLATGMDKDFQSLMLSGERMFNLKHQINLKRGLDPASDTLPPRFFSQKRGQGSAAGHLPPIKEMVKDYYRIRGWEASGKIKAGKLKALGLEEL